MNDNDIKKALEELVKLNIKYGASKKAMVDVEFLKGVLALYHRQKVEIKALEMDNAQLQSDNFNANMNCEHLQAEIERLRHEDFVWENTKLLKKVKEYEAQIEILKKDLEAWKRDYYALVANFARQIERESEMERERE